MITTSYGQFPTLIYVQDHTVLDLIDGMFMIAEFRPALYWLYINYQLDALIIIYS